MNSITWDVISFERASSWFTAMTNRQRRTLPLNPAFQKTRDGASDARLPRWVNRVVVRTSGVGAKRTVASIVLAWRFRCDRSGAQVISGLKLRGNPSPQEMKFPGLESSLRDSAASWQARRSPLFDLSPKRRRVTGIPEIGH
jgi:hypothetical protein